MTREKLQLIEFIENCYNDKLIKMIICIVNGYLGKQKIRG